MKQILITIVAGLLVGCSRNEIIIANSGTNVWEKVEITAGGHKFNIDKLEAGKFRQFSFRSKQEGGGLITAELNGGKFEKKFGYYTPNLTSKDAIILNNNTHNDVEIINMEATVLTIDEVINERRKNKHSSAFKNLRVLGEELKTEKK
ncbi:MAG: hypothetical protein QF731_07790 [Verrucomicrobiota bacterium]|jgi:hypothetical protein|nr:hypothetical protein [Verrucomicrobiota bacterium]